MLERFGTRQPLEFDGKTANFSERMIFERFEVICCLARSPSLKLRLLTIRIPLAFSSATFIFQRRRFMQSGRRFASPGVYTSFEEKMELKFPDAGNRSCRSAKFPPIRECRNIIA